MKTKIWIGVSLAFGLSAPSCVSHPVKITDVHPRAPAAVSTPANSGLLTCANTICQGAKGRVSDVFADAASLQEIETKAQKDSEFVRQYDNQMMTIDRELVRLQRESIKRAIAFANGQELQPTSYEIYTFNRALLVDAMSSDFNHADTVDKKGHTYSQLKYHEKFMGMGYDPTPLFQAMTETQRQKLMRVVDARAQAIADSKGGDLTVTDKVSVESLIVKLAPAPKFPDSVRKFAQQIVAQMSVVENAPVLGHRLSFKQIAPSVSTDFVKAVASGRDISWDDLTKLITAREALAVLVNDFTNAQQIAQMNTLATEFLKNAKFKQALIDRFQDDLKGLELVYDDRGAMPPYFYTRNACAKAYAKQIALAPSAQQIEVAKETEVTARKFVKNFVLTKFPTENPAQTEKMVNGWTFVLPETEAAVKTKFTAYIESARELVDHRSPTLNPDDFISSGSWMDFCVDEDQQSNVIRDFTVTVEGRIITGWESVLYPEMGVQVMSHEMGHMLSTSFQQGLMSPQSTTKFLAARKCISDKHAGEKQSHDLKARGRVLHESGFAEEDWADVVAGESNPNVGLNLWCTEYLSGNPSFDIHGAQGDVHSSGFFRMLQTEAQHKGQLSPQCTSALNDAGLVVNTGPCI